MRLLLSLFCLFIIFADSAQAAKKTKAKLSAQQYYQMGLDAKRKGHCENARSAMLWAVHVDKNGSTGKKAALYLKTTIPRYKVPRAAEKANIKAFSADHRGHKAEAKSLYLRVIQAYPNFEWPYNNLASIYTSEKNTTEARKLLNKALRVNPTYIHALLGLGQTYMVDGDINSAKHYAKLAEKIDPSDEAVIQFKKVLKSFDNLQEKIEALKNR